MIDPRIRILPLVAVASVVVAGPACEPLPPPEPPEPEVTCAESCPYLEEWGCKAGERVCNLFDDEGRCVQRITCRGDCELNPQAHPSPQCVVEIAAADAGNPCAAVEELCW